MKKISFKFILLVGLIFCSKGMALANGYGDLTADCAAPAGNGASAATICINMGGSSAVTAFATQIPIDLFDPTQPIFHYTNATSGTLAAGKLHVWTGTLTSAAAGVTTPGVIRYSATGSSDGYARLDCQATGNVAAGTYVSTGYCGGGQATNITTAIPTANIDANLNALDFGNFALGACTISNAGTTAKNYLGNTVTYTDNSGCSGLVPNGLPIHLGAADVDGSSFHQTGPLGTAVKQLDSTPLTVTAVSMFPFQFVVGSGVTYSLGAMPSLTREEIQGILSGATTDWTLLPGFGISAGLNATFKKPVLCLRSAGSGTKATVQVTQMKDGVGEAIVAGTNTIFNSSTQNVINCVNANPGAIGYIDADQVSKVTSAGGQGVLLNGVAPNEPTAVNPKRNVQNGVYDFWVGERFTYRTQLDASMNATQQTVINSMISDAQNAAIYRYLPAGAFWVPPTQMCVTKNNDGGPIKWTNPAPAGCPVP